MPPISRHSGAIWRLHATEEFGAHIQVLVADQSILLYNLMACISIP